MKTLLTIFVSVLVAASQQKSNPKTGSKVTEEDMKKALAVHNKARKAVGVPALVWSADLAKYAQAWADQLAAKCKMQHRPHAGKWKQLYGENIYWGSTSSYTVEDACNAWLEEKKYFKNVSLSAKNWEKTGHYTQMIWKSTTKIGLGKAVCEGGDVIVVANYDPAGNYMGEKAY
ncbi:MAG: hypothetical protein K0S33_3904 [Bacteroidetes bacterium]|jgi:uncharacterized protein YkwD|nr:hypothetical protein [Bacteroidota bacterium]